MRNVLMFAIALFIAGFGTVLATAQQPSPDTFESNELIETGHKFFGTVSRSLAGVIEKAVSQWGRRCRRGGAALRGRYALYQECWRPAGLLAGSFDPTISLVTWGPIRDGAHMREGGCIRRQDASRQVFWDSELLKPYLDAWRLRRQELLGTEA
jgi:hypothetical protein